MKSFPILLLAIFCLTSAVASTETDLKYPECNNKCAVCGASQGCTTCIGFWKVKKGSKYECGEEIAADRNCVIGEVDRWNKKNCEKCKKGYQVKYDKDSREEVCVAKKYTDEPKKVNGCLPGKQWEGLRSFRYYDHRFRRWMTGQKKDYGCDECDISQKYWFGTSGQNCVQIITEHQNPTYRRKVKKIYETCESAQYIYKRRGWWTTQIYRCIKCKPGKIRAESGNCVDYQGEGCVKIDGDGHNKTPYCVWCNVRGGYYMSEPKKCVQRTSSE